LSLFVHENKNPVVFFGDGAEQVQQVFFVMAVLDTAIHVDPRVKPGGEEVKEAGSSPPTPFPSPVATEVVE